MDKNNVVPKQKTRVISKNFLKHFKRMPENIEDTTPKNTTKTPSTAMLEGEKPSGVKRGETLIPNAVFKPTINE